MPNGMIECMPDRTSESTVCQIRPHRSVGAGRAGGAAPPLVTLAKIYSHKTPSSHIALLGGGAFFSLPAKRLKLQGHSRERFEGGFWVDCWLRFAFTAMQVSVLEEILVFDWFFAPRGPLGRALWRYSWGLFLSMPK